MKGKLIKIESNHKNLRTDEMEGQFAEYPTKGMRFVIFGEPLNKDEDVRVISTSPVQDINFYMGDVDSCRFTTENSEYKLIIYKEENDEAE